MSAKRAAPTELNHDNWDQDDTPNEEDQQGQFKMASKEVLEKRVIRTAKRRSQATSDEAKKGVFSGFSGFNKAQKPSFDFLANLTNGKKPNSETPISENETTILPSSLGSKQSASPSSGIFSVSGTSTPITKSVFGQQNSGSSIFGGTGTPAFTQSVYSTLKPTVSDSPFKVPSSLNSLPNVTLNSNSNSGNTSQASTNLFGTSSTSANMNNSLFSNTTNSQTTFKTTTVTTCSSKSSEVNKSTSTSDIKDDKKLVYHRNLRGLNESVSAWIKKHVDETPLCILSPIFRDYEKHLKNIQEEYEKNTEDFDSNTSDVKQNSSTDNKISSLSHDKSSGSALFSATKSSNSLFSQNSDNVKTTETSNFSFGIKPPSTNTVSTSATPNAGFSFGIRPSNSSLFAANTPATNVNSSLFATEATTTNANSPRFVANTSTTSPNTSPFGFKPSTTNSNVSPFAINPSTTNSNLSPFAVNTSANTLTSSFTLKSPTTNANTSSFTLNTTTNTNTSPFTINTTTNANISPFAANNSTTSTNGNTPFSFGIGKPFGFSSNIKKTDEPVSNEDNDNEDEQPKVEYTPIVEENSVYDKKCKVYVKKDGNFIDKGVGTLYIKKIDDSGKYQLLVRANTSLGNILLNLILSSSIPTQRMGKNNVMMVCIPTPDAKPPPTSILIRVKTSEDADDLLEVLNKYKA